MGKDLVSIVITTYNGVDTIEYAVLSALNQTYKNIEIIVVDDNGLNSEKQVQTKNILNKYIKCGKIFYYPHKKNMNGSAARNTGVSISKGEWITFLDDDDIYLREKVEKELNKVKENNADMVICGGFFIDKNGRGYKTKFNSKTNILKDYLTEKVLFNTSTFLINKNSFKLINGFDDSFRRHQDWEFFTRSFVELNITIVNETLIAKYKFGRNNASNPKIAEEYINHFFDRVGEILFNFNKKDYINILNYQMFRIAKEYRNNGQKDEYYRVLNKVGIHNCYLKILFDKIRHIVKKVLFGLKKRYKSYNEVVSELELTRGNMFDEK